MAEFVKGQIWNCALACGGGSGPCRQCLNAASLRSLLEWDSPQLLHGHNIGGSGTLTILFSSIRGPLTFLLLVVRAEQLSKSTLIGGKDREACCGGLILHVGSGPGSDLMRGHDIGSMRGLAPCSEMDTDPFHQEGLKAGHSPMSLACLGHRDVCGTVTLPFLLAKKAQLVCRLLLLASLTFQAEFVYIVRP